jgi:hypothetical protein
MVGSIIELCFGPSLAWMIVGCALETCGGLLFGLTSEPYKRLCYLCLGSGG